eukprot:TRINITY_DN13314_c0_g1_i1.p1 TRINITY_DN13314_c0_g1~~TRINITY_DN13314_c0_g1_i1.p1  ORF type:complete len:254 (+),score=61.85 TRINITY_DN13314_c0_g1_i1:878-1639(+)
MSHINKKVYLITGSNRGLGLELVQQLLKNRSNYIICTCRNPDNAEVLNTLLDSHPERLMIEQLDVTNIENCSTLAAKLSELNIKINILINNAAIFIKEKAGLGIKFENIESETLLDHFNVNLIGSINVTQKLLPLIESYKQSDNNNEEENEENFAIIANISSRMGSIKYSTATCIPYRLSKTAFNMFTKVLSNELTDHVVVSIHPGWVKTDMGGKRAKYEPTEAISKVLEIIDTLNKDDTGKFLTYGKEELAW